MFKTENWIIILFGFFIAIFFVFSWHTRLLSVQTDNDKHFERMLLESQEAGMGLIDVNKSNAFEDEETRKAVLEKLKVVFNQNFSKYGFHKDDINFMVPATFLVDNDGYYINYSRLTDNGGNDELKNLTTPLNTWNKSYGDYSIRFFLNDYCEVTKIDGEIISGDILQVYKKLEKPTELSFIPSHLNLEKKEDVKRFYGCYEEEKRYVVLTDFEDQLNYFITTHNKYKNRHERSYRVTIPRTDKSYDSRLLNMPSIVSFVQGPQYSSTKGYINVYALTGTIKEKGRLYYISPLKENNTKYYHYKNCSHAVHARNNRDKTMTECAREGALPCPYCIK